MTMSEHDAKLDEFLLQFVDDKSELSPIVIVLMPDLEQSFSLRGFGANAKYLMNEIRQREQEQRTSPDKVGIE